MSSSDVGSYVFASALSFFLGIVASVVAAAIWHELGRDILWRTRILLWRVRRITLLLLGKLVKPPVFSKSDRGLPRVGNTEVPMVISLPGPFSPETIKTYWDARPWNLHPVIQPLYDDLQRQWDELRQQGKHPPYDGRAYKLEAFDPRDRVGVDEVPLLHLHFRPTDYCTMMATNKRMDEPICVGGQPTTLRKLFAAPVDLLTRPVPEFANNFAVVLLLLTIDGKAIVGQRGNTAEDPFAFIASVAENALRPQDAGPSGGADPYRTAIRGAIEELGVELEKEDVKFLYFAADVVDCRFGLYGVSRVRLTSEELKDARVKRVPKDRWEIRQLFTPSWNPKDIAQFVSSHGPWTPPSLMLVYQALLESYSPRTVETAFVNATIRLTRTLSPDVRL